MVVSKRVKRVVDRLSVVGNDFFRSPFDQPITYHPHHRSTLRCFRRFAIKSKSMSHDLFREANFFLAIG